MRSGHAAVRGAGHARDHRRAVCDPAARHRKVGRLFGPIMVLWFVSIGLLGLRAIVHAPEVLTALDPGLCAALLLSHPGVALTILGAVFLVLTGGEALYVDMGHFGKQPVRVAWFLRRVARAAAQLLRPGRAAARRADDRHQSVLRARHARRAAVPGRARDRGRRHRLAGDDLRRVLGHAPGRAARPAAARARSCRPPPTRTGRSTCRRRTLFMFFATCAFVLVFQGSSALSGAYGAAVIGTMVITTLLGADRGARRVEVAAVARRGSCSACSAWSISRSSLGNATKIPSGGWVPLALSAAMFAVFVTWRDGRALLRERTAAAGRAARRAAGAAEDVDPRAGHGRIPREPPGLRADRAAAQPRAQPRLPRERS